MYIGSLRAIGKGLYLSIHTVFSLLASSCRSVGALDFRAHIAISYKEHAGLSLLGAAQSFICLTGPLGRFKEYPTWRVKAT